MTVEFEFVYLADMTRNVLDFPCGRSMLVPVRLSDRDGSELCPFHHQHGPMSSERIADPPPQERIVKGDSSPVAANMSDLHPSESEAG